jgi:hypothetical protein
MDWNDSYIASAFLPSRFVCPQGRTATATLDRGDISSNPRSRSARRGISNISYRKIFSEVCSQKVEDDGFVFLPDTIRVERIREDEAYEGVRVRVEGVADEEKPCRQFRRASQLHANVRGQEGNYGARDSCPRMPQAFRLPHRSSCARNWTSHSSGGRSVHRVGRRHLCRHHVILRCQTILAHAVSVYSQRGRHVVAAEHFLDGLDVRPFPYTENSPSCGAGCGTRNGPSRLP